ncbi:MAG: CRTAC1 family protein [Bacteriovorax sp.]|nr:CRTAC1 family protein [Bacteriovorax sp.]
MKSNYTKNPFYRGAVLVLGFGSMIYLFFFNPPKDQLDNVYETKKFDHKQFGNIHFKDLSTQLGIEYRHNIFALDPKLKQELDLSSEPLPPSVSVIDINNDGYMDIYITTSKNRPNLLYINHQGKYFSEEAAKFGLADLNQESVPSYAFWGDFNNDGLLDLVYARHGCHSFFTGTKNGKFVEHQEWFKGYCSKPNGVNAADFYHHGRLDLVFANYLPDPKEGSTNVLWMSNTRYDNTTGGKNHLLRNDGKSFQIEDKANFQTSSYTHNAGIADINLDGYPDIFFSNDYAHDEMFLNLKNGNFQDVTNQYIPKEVHGLAGMNTEFFDFNSDGLIDLYVTNIFKPPFNRHFNLLWKKKVDNTFENVSNDLGVAKCGFSWAAKFADINNDGDPDLLVTNGRSRSANLKKFGEGKSMWYERIEVSQIPEIIRQFYQPHDSLKGRYISAFERKCLFVQKNGEFFDIADDAGFNDREENRVMALIDYDNDGKMDVITAGTISKLKIFHNDTEINLGNHWVGFSFEDKNGSSIPHGAHIKFNLSNGKKISRELYPANGYRGFNDPRIHVGLGNAQIVGDIEIFWPLNRVTTKINKVKLDQYNKLLEVRN